MQKYRRQIFYFSGFDPRGANFYHKLYKDELAKFAVLDNREAPIVSVRKSPAAQRVEWQIETEDCITDYTFMRWDDLVRDRWRVRKDKLLFRVISTYVSFLRGARNREALKLAPVVGKTFYFPVFLVALPLLLTLLATALFSPLFLLAFPLVFAAVYLVFRRWQPGWLLHIFTFNRELCGAQHVDLDIRCDIHVLHIASSLAADSHDEVLLVGHSNGCALILMVLDRLLAQGLTSNPKLKVLTLAQLVQMVSLHRNGVKLRETLGRLATLPVTWLDVSAKADPACFALVGPFAPVASPPARLTIASARLHRLYTPETYKRLKADKFNYHFLYLKCTDRLGAYSYPRLTAYGGPLEDRIAAIKADALA